MLALAAAWCALSLACDRRATLADDVSVEWRMAPERPSVGRPVHAEIRVLDNSRTPIPGGRLRVEGHMSHAGMTPVITRARERGGGIYEAQWRFTMRGDWILLVTGTLPDGRRIEHRIDVPNVQPPG